MKKIRSVIIDDVPLAISSLKADLEDYCPEIELVGTADSVISGLKLLKNTEADLVFLDIDLNDGDGFDILDLLESSEISVIFTTASQDHAIRAFQYAAVDYLLKPIDPELLKNAVAKVHPGNMEVLQLKSLRQSLQHDMLPNKLTVHTQDRIQIIDIANISSIEADGNYSFIHLAKGSKILVSKTLKEYDNLLSDRQFVRVHQSHLVNLDQIREFIKTDGGYIIMKNNDRIPVSVRKKSLLLSLLK